MIFHGKNYPLSGDNRSVREALVKTDIYPERLPAAEDIRKIESRHRKEMKVLQTKQKKELEEATKKLSEEQQ